LAIVSKALECSFDPDRSFFLEMMSYLSGFATFKKLETSFRFSGFLALLISISAHPTTNTNGIKDYTTGG
jgi:hypothetical protein